MPYDPLRHHRHSIRLKGYDYRLAGAYFVTICTQHRVCLLEPPPVIDMVGHWWEELPRKFTTVSLDAFVIMPNHVHAIILLDPPPTTSNSTPLSQVLQWFKTMTTNAYIRGVKEAGWPPFDGRLWQRNYYEHIVRNERALNAIRAYIEANPFNWERDNNHPSRLLANRS